MEEMRKLYNANAKFKEYVDKYCKNRDLPLEVVLSHKIVQSYAEEIKRGQSL